MSADQTKPNYKDTLSLPETSFPMRGNLVENEPKRLQSWADQDLYQRIQKRRKDQGAPRFILHDGPPFANGDVHMGTALNKVLKDLVLKSKTMAGYETPYVPGWDCHGLPIEYKVMQDARDEEPAEVRRRCTEFAKGFIDIQRESFRRLGVFGDWENPYLTLDPGYESDIIRTFGKLVEMDAVYQSRKPVLWSYGAGTALAEAEVEYMDKKSMAAYVRFPLADAEGDLSDASMVIWTTTPWTLPANLGIAVHERFDYVCGEFGHEDGRTVKLVLAKDLLSDFAEKTGFVLKAASSEFKGGVLEGLHAQHPFLPRTSKLILANFVTTDTGTGAVHIAPGHGADDYVAGQQNDLGLLSPVDDDGKFTDECGLEELVGQHVFKTNKRITEMLAEGGNLLGQELYAHQYPHCWRSKTPIIFRAVEQFFISLKDIRGKALEEIDQVNWLPKWGRNRIYGTVEARPDWCISRQRTWGVPLPVFFSADGEAIIDPALIGKVADLVETEGTNIWFELDDAELAKRLGLPEGCRKCRDTLDVWIDSGSSHVAVLDRHPELSAPADLIIEATDQHRGWFQSSLMLSVAARGKAPYKAVMTHGFVVDTSGKKISKSGSKPINAKHYYDQFGSDIVRLWAASVDWQTEVPFSDKLFKQVTDPYRRLRNTLRILLGNIHGFDPASQSVAKQDMTLLDRWVLERLNEVIAECRDAYEHYQFRKVFNQINHFCTHELSALYIDITKDRMYCDAPDSVRRLAAQTVMFRVFDAICRLVAPILVFTADEAWEHAGHEGSVHEQDFPIVDEAFTPGEAIAQVGSLLEIRAVIQTAIEKEVQAKLFNKNNEAEVTLTLPAGHPCSDLLADREFVTEFFILADLNVVEGEEVSATAKATGHAMCPRCRRYEPLVTEVCQRCSEVV
ncbi:isoleucine--tRNA ligase [Verrucomicrobiaceae bacterium N1E253]|uniref:Isoleucine--tRNA ligase n=1 Tax=Oceaniferula marina TaxID=2748318 RepID=A0A851GKC2_9BACT|nr:isoleucine--tRNA ligase [Oceaniferula marina]NWK56301.1 isoleucine--tRNA ligase [Oceaniferula marina]